MFSQKTLQKILFVCLLVISVTAFRLVAQIKLGALLIALALLGLLVWVCCRLATHIGRQLWVWSGDLAHFFVSNSTKAAAVQAKE